MMKFFSRDSFRPGSYSQVTQDDSSSSSRKLDNSKELAWRQSGTSEVAYHGSRRLRVALWTLGILSATVFVALSSFYLGMSYKQTRRHIEFFPEIGRRTVVFEEVSIFSEPPSTESDRAWDSLLPPGRGFISVEDPAAYGLDPGIETDTGTDRYAVSMFHQLHCLGMIRKNFFKVVSATAHMGEQDIETADPLAFESIQHQMYHTNHCFDYIRQGIMCSGDTTVEWAIQNSDGSRHTVDGWGVPHRQCKNLDMIWDFMLEHHAPNNRTNIA